MLDDLLICTSISNDYSQAWQQMWNAKFSEKSDSNKIPYSFILQTPCLGKILTQATPL